MSRARSKSWEIPVVSTCLSFPSPGDLKQRGGLQRKHHDPEENFGGAVSIVCCFLSNQLPAGWGKISSLDFALLKLLLSSPSSRRKAILSWQSNPWLIPQWCSSAWLEIPVPLWTKLAVSAIKPFYCGSLVLPQVAWGFLSCCSVPSSSCLCHGLGGCPENFKPAARAGW